MTNSSFILQLSLVLSKLMQDLTLRSAKTFGKCIFNSSTHRIISYLLHEKNLNDN